MAKGMMSFVEWSRMGRPPKFETADELSAKVDEYFQWCKGEKKMEVDEGGIVEWIREPEPLTITGIALYCGFMDRSSFYDQADRGTDFSYIVKRARAYIENAYEKRLGNSNQVTGAIFALKNMGWADKIVTENTNIAIQWEEHKTYYDSHSKANDSLRLPARSDND